MKRFSFDGLADFPSTSQAVKKARTGRANKHIDARRCALLQTCSLLGAGLVVAGVGACGNGGLFAHVLAGFGFAKVPGAGAVVHLAMDPYLAGGGYGS
jgi:hypothetical protein